MSSLPRLLEEIREVAGLPAALRIAEMRGGGRATIPVKLKDDHWLIEAVGRADAEKIAFHFTSGRGTVEIEVPLGPVGTLAKARQNMVKLIESGDASCDAIARATGMSRRTVLRQKSKISHRRDEDQGDLF